MALLLPLIWRGWMKNGTFSVKNDCVGEMALIGDIPEYAIDQFTRAGGQVARAYLREDDEMRRVLDEASVDAARALHPRPCPKIARRQALEPRHGARSGQAGGEMPRRLSSGFGLAEGRGRRLP